MDKKENQLKIAGELLRKTESFSDWTVEKTQDYLSPYIDAGQLVMGTSRQGEDETHFGFALWSKVDDKTDEALRSGEIDPRNSGTYISSNGNHCWILDMVCPTTVAEAFLRSTASAVFPGQNVMARLTSKSGEPRFVIVQKASQN